MTPTNLQATIKATVIGLCAAYGIDQRRAEAGCAAMFRELDGKGCGAVTSPEPIDRVLSRQQVAALLGCSTKAVSDKVRRGALVAVYGGANATRMTGIRESSVREYIAKGKPNAEKEAA